MLSSTNSLAIRGENIGETQLSVGGVALKDGGVPSELKVYKCREKGRCKTLYGI